MRYALTALALAGAVSAQGTQMPLPAFSNTFTSASLTRGFYFQAPGAAPFIISGLRVPDESAHGLQNVEVLTFPGGDPSATPAIGTQQFFSVGQPSANIIPCTVIINPGDWVGIYGACGDATTMRNSYGAGGFASDVLGNPVTINRLFTQVNIVSNPGSAQSTGTTGSIGRVEVYVTPSNGLFPSFDTDVDSGPSPLTVNFTDTTFTSDPAGVVAWIWDFDNDGTPDSNLQNPSFTYASCGTYDVSLTAVDAMHGPITIVETARIEVDPIDASFTAAAGPSNMVTYTDTTVGATSWAWDFDNDGTVDSTVQNPVHTFPAGGFYDTTLTVMNACNTSTVTEQVSTFGLLCSPTAYLGGNGGNAGWMNMFDVNVTAPNGILVSGMGVNFSAAAGTAATLDVYITPGSYVGNELDATVWTKVASGSLAASAGANLESLVDVSDFQLNPGAYGIAILYGGSGMSYTNGTGANQTAMNADLSMSLGVSTTGLFSGSIFNPRIWNGCLYYDAFNTGGYYNGHKPGCDGTAGRTTLSTASAPKIGQTLAVDIADMPANGVGLMVLGFDDTNSGGVPLPFDLTGVGAPGCSVNIEAFENFLVIADPAGAASWSLSIPNDVAFIGANLFNQVLVIDAGVNTVGIVMSDSAIGGVGQ